ncbi:WbuC family cupin fold metalloprotein [Geofilum rubicundum]|nr:WbuC family cupin fold metalloprotein [Geofilum rubicundum]
MMLIHDDLLDSLSQEAKDHPRKRRNHNFHTSLADPINRMLNALEPESYVCPHKHEGPDKREVFIRLKGRLAVFYFDDAGAVTDQVVLGSDEGNYGVEIPAGTWHTIVALESGTIVYEIKDGPYHPEDDKHFAPWAPREGSAEASVYLQKLLSLLGADGHV